MAHVVATTKQASFIFVLDDEVNTIDHESWLSVHAYVYRKGKWSFQSILVTFMRFMEGNNS
jgi:hypothetical protein